jgi:hypothetical protein
MMLVELQRICMQPVLQIRTPLQLRLIGFCRLVMN